MTDNLNDYNEFVEALLDWIEDGQNEHKDNDDDGLRQQLEREEEDRQRLFWMPF